MKKARSTDGVEVKVGRFNEPTITVKLQAGASVQDALDEADINLGSAESVWVDGETAEPTDTVENGDHLQIVGKKEGGR
jgi:hypothetical protein